MTDGDAAAPGQPDLGQARRTALMAHAVGIKLKEMGQPHSAHLEPVEGPACLVRKAGHGGKEIVPLRPLDP